MSNPITDSINAYWVMLESQTDFSTLFPHGTMRQVRYDSTSSYAPDPDLIELNPADYPRCRVRLTEAVPQTERNSGKSLLWLRIETEVCTGQEHQDVAYDAAWSIYRAHLSWRDYLRDVVTWNGESCVFDVDSRGLQLTDDNAERNRGTKQWIPVWTTDIRLELTTTALQASGT